MTAGRLGNSMRNTLHVHVTQTTKRGAKSVNMCISVHELLINCILHKDTDPENCDGGLSYLVAIANYPHMCREHVRL